MKVLVTGGTGFTGKALVKRLLDEGHAVTVMDSKEGIDTQDLRDRGSDVEISSITDRDAVRRCMRGVDIVQHLAAAFRDLNVSEGHYYEVNVSGTRIVLEEAKNAGVKKFIYCSTCGVHGNVDHPPGDETTPIAPADYYQRTKFLAETIVHEFQQRGMPCVIIRPAAIYGPGDPERFLMIFRQVNMGIFPMFGNGKTLYHPVFIDNLVDAFLLAMEDGKGDGETYLIADEEFVEIENLVRRVAKALKTETRIPHFPAWPVVLAGHICERICKPFGVTPPIFPRRVDWFRQNRAFDISKAKRELGYQPRIGLNEGLQRTAEWYKSEGYL